ncbi:uncharacterized protein [Elaeis guineensis]|uniref:uncharacterized protein n=1 Tax=Elaeis guineensis var. tenera TaxID=51953 RepID=UPI003C6D35EA
MNSWQGIIWGWQSSAPCNARVRTGRQITGVWRRVGVPCPSRIPSPPPFLFDAGGLIIPPRSAASAPLDLDRCPLSSPPASHPAPPTAPPITNSPTRLWRRRRSSISSGRIRGAGRGRGPFLGSGSDWAVEVWSWPGDGCSLCLWRGGGGMVVARSRGPSRGPAMWVEDLLGYEGRYAHSDARFSFWNFELHGLCLEALLSLLLHVMLMLKILDQSDVDMEAYSIEWMAMCSWAHYISL